MRGHLQGEKYMTASVFDYRKPWVTVLAIPLLLCLENTHLIGLHFSH